jgi:multidrug transporter EmrE-like cation transporter
MTKFLIFILAGCGLVLSTVGCSSSGQISDLTEVSNVKTVMGAAVGLISGSSQNEKTSTGYTVSASIGAWAGGAVSQKTSTGYVVYSNVQGSLTSESTIAQ